jgi:hypothetical protein
VTVPGLPVDPADWRVWLAAFAAVALCALLLRRGPRTPAVEARPFLTGNEREFLGRLERALPEARIHAQVAMGALLRPTHRPKGRKGEARQRAVRARFDRKICDYVVEDRRTGAVIAVVELDDRTHVAARDRARDAMMARAGYRTVRWDSRAKPDAAGIRARIIHGR